MAAKIGVASRDRRHAREDFMWLEFCSGVPVPFFERATWGNLLGEGSDEDKSWKE